MGAQVAIVNYHVKMLTFRTVASYAASILFIIVAALLIVFAPANRETAATIAAGAFVILALGIAGFTRFSAKGKGVTFSAEGEGKR